MFRTNRTNRVCRIGRAGVSVSAAAAFTPTSIASLTRWYKAGSGVYKDQIPPTLPVAIDGDPAQDWVDQGPVGAEAPNANLTSTWETAEINGQPAVDFNSDQFDEDTLASYTLSNIIGLTQGHVFVVLKQNPTASLMGPFEIGDGLTNTYVSLASTAANLLSFKWGGAGDVVTAPQPGGWDSAWHAVELSRTGTTPNIRVDGSNLSLTGSFVGGLTDGTNASMRLGKPAHLAGEVAWSGMIAEFVVFKTFLSGTDLTNMRTYITDKYALTT